MVFPGTTGDRFCSYSGNSTTGDCHPTNYILVSLFITGRSLYPTCLTDGFISCPGGHLPAGLPWRHHRIHPVAMSARLCRQLLLLEVSMSTHARTKVSVLVWTLAGEGHVQAPTPSRADRPLLRSRHVRRALAPLARNDHPAHHISFVRQPLFCGDRAH